jgi:hypothetical protein
MLRKAIIGALLLIALGALLGGTVLRDQVASAKTLAQSVFVSNTSANPVPVSDGRTQISFFASETTGSPGECDGLNIYTVPPGKQFVAEFMSFIMITGLNATADTATLFGSNGLLASFALSKATAGRWAGSQSIHLVYPSGTTLGFNTQPEGATDCGGGITVGGYLEAGP